MVGLIGKSTSEISMRYELLKKEQEQLLNTKKGDEDLQVKKQEKLLCDILCVYQGEKLSLEHARSQIIALQEANLMQEEKCQSLQTLNQSLKADLCKVQEELQTSQFLLTEEQVNVEAKLDELQVQNSQLLSCFNGEKMAHKSSRLNYEETLRSSEADRLQLQAREQDLSQKLADLNEHIVQLKSQQEDHLEKIQASEIYQTFINQNKSLWVNWLNVNKIH